MMIDNVMYIISLHEHVLYTQGGFKSSKRSPFKFLISDLQVQLTLYVATYVMAVWGVNNTHLNVDAIQSPTSDCMTYQKYSSFKYQLSHVDPLHRKFCDLSWQLRPTYLYRYFSIACN